MSDHPADVPFDVGGYRATSPLATAGHHRVWRGVRLADGGPVAMKVFPADALALARREAALAVAVDHPHVVGVIEVVSGPEHAVLVTELAAGGSLADVLARRGTLAAAELLTVMIPLADALAAAHERDIVHGDVTAANVLFDAAGRPLLADLGASRAAAEQAIPVFLTATDVAPEVARGAVPAAAGDLFSLGSVALHCLTGRPAWPADDLRDVLIQSAAGQWPEPPDGSAPDALLSVVRRLLDPEPADRGSAAAVSVELRRAGRPMPVDLRPRAPAEPGAEPRGPATRMRPDSMRMAALTGDPTGRARRRGWPGWRSGAAHVPRRAAGHAAGGRSGGRPVVGRSGAKRYRSGSLRIVAYLVVGVLLAGSAAAAGLWWASRARPGPATVAAAVPVSPAAVSAAVPASPTSSAAPTVGPDVDWLTIVKVLDAGRGAALAARDSTLLDAVYTPDSAGLVADARMIADLTAAGHLVAGATHQIRSVAVDAAAPTTPGLARLRVVESLPAYAVRNESGADVGTTAPGALTAIVLVLAATGAGYRIAEILPD